MPETQDTEKVHSIDSATGIRLREELIPRPEPRGRDDVAAAIRGGVARNRASPKRKRRSLWGRLRERVHRAFRLKPDIPALTRSS